VKICGITTVTDARVAIDAGADALGFVFAKSPRQVDISSAIRLMSYIPAFVTGVAVFRYPTTEEVKMVVSQCAPNLVQAEPTPAVKAALRDRARFLPVFHDGADVLDEVYAYARSDGAESRALLEASGRGGSGIAPDWNSAARIARVLPLVLAGGLNPDNVREAIRRVRPSAVDVSSGVESAPGVKDPVRVRDFVLEVREAETLMKAEVSE
jgi:phosphoribosylanthranilate isomerase